MLRNANYIYNNVVIADENNTTKQFCKPAQVGVDLSIKKVNIFETAGFVSTGKTHVGVRKELPTEKLSYTNAKGETFEFEGWYLPKGTYDCELNEGVTFSETDTGYVIMRSSLNRNGVSVQSAVWDPGFTTAADDGKVFSMGVRITVDNENGLYLEKNARVAQLIVFENEPTSLYNGQFQNGRTDSRLK